MTETLIQYWLPAAVVVDGSVIDTTRPSAIGGDHCEIHAPGPAGNGDGHLTPPSVLSRVPEADPDVAWGWPVGGPNSPDEGYAIEVVVITVPRKMRPAELRKLHTGLHSWASSLRDWVEVLTTQDLDGQSPLNRAHAESQGIRAWADGQELKLSSVLHFDFDFGLPLSLNQWERVLQHVAAGTRPSPEHLLLRDAAAALRRKQYRRAVLDAGTALEIALWQIVMDEHRDNPTPLGQAVLKDEHSWMLRRLLDVVKMLTSVPPSINGGVVNVRNNTIHKSAHQPTAREAEQAVDAARDAVALTSSAIPPELTS